MAPKKTINPTIKRELAELHYLISIVNGESDKLSRERVEGIYDTELSIKLNPNLISKGKKSKSSMEITDEMNRLIRSRLQGMVVLIVSGVLPSSSSPLVNYLQDWYSGKKDLEKQKYEFEIKARENRNIELEYEVNQLKKKAVPMSTINTFHSFLMRSVHNFYTSIEDLVTDKDTLSDNYKSLIDDIKSAGDVMDKPQPSSVKKRKRRAKSK